MLCYNNLMGRNSKGDLFVIDNILMVGNQVIILFVLIAIGFICSKTKILKDNMVKGLTDIILYIVSPCVIINSYQREFEPEMLNGLLIALAASAASFAVDILLVHILVHDKDKKREGVLRFGAVFSNCGFMSLPLQNALLGADGVFYGTTYIAVVNILLWTYGVCVMSGDTKNISVKNIITNPGIIGTILGVVIFVFSVKLPSVISEPLRYLAALNTPIPMLIIGYHLAHTRIKISGAPTIISIIFRLIISPAIMLTGLYLFGIRGPIMVACVVAAAAPYAATTTMFSEKFGGDTALSAACVSVTTLISVLTMPLIIGIASMVK